MSRNLPKFSMLTKAYISQIHYPNVWGKTESTDLNLQILANLVTFSEEILDRKFNFLCCETFL